MTFSECTAQWDREVTGVLDVDYKLGPAARRNLANGAELLASVRSKSLESYFNFFLHDASPKSCTGCVPLHFEWSI